MATTNYKAYIVAQNDTGYTILTEHDKQYHQLALPVVEGRLKLEDGTVVHVSNVRFNPVKIFAACRDYDYNLQRKRNQYARRKLRKQQNDMESTVSSVDSPITVSIPLVNPFETN